MRPFLQNGLPKFPERHNDSLFESSKASTNNQTSIMRRQFKGGKQAITLNANLRPNEMLGAAVFGSRMRPTKQSQNSATLKAGSTKPGSQVTELTSNLRQRDQKTNATKPIDASNLGEASFAATAHQDAQGSTNGLGERRDSPGTREGPPASGLNELAGEAASSNNNDEM